MGKQIVHDGPLPRFAGGRLIQPGESYDPDVLDTETYVVESTPAGTLTVAQLEALIAKKKGQPTDDVTTEQERIGLSASTGDGVNTDVRLAPTSPAAVDPSPDAEQEKAIAAADKASTKDQKAEDERREELSDVQRKAAAAAELTALGVDFDARQKADKLEKLLAEHKAK